MGVNSPITGSLNWIMLAATTISTTFKIRYGPASGTVTFNGTNGASRFGGVAASYLGVKELMG
jgi:hypothetical protein